MPDNVDTQSTTPATVPASTKWATRTVTYSGDAGAQIAPTGLVAFAGSDDAKTVADIGGDATNGLDVDVTRLPALVAGTANIGDVDVLTVPAPLSTTGGGTEATALRVTVASNSTGLLPVSLASVPSHAVTNAGTFAVQDSEKIADNAGFTDGTTKVVPVGYIYDEVAGTALTENDIGTPRMNANRAGIGIIEDGTTRARYATVTAANALKVDASGVAVPVTDNSGSLTVDAPVGTPAFVRLSDGAAAITTLPVSLASAPSTAVTNAGTFAVQATIQASGAGEDITRISVTPTVSTSPAYTAKDAVGGLLTFANAARVSARGGILHGVTIVDKSQQRPSLELVLFNQTFTASTDNAVFNPSDADLANVVADVALNSWADFSTNSVCSVMGLGLPFSLTGTSLFGQLLTRGTPTFVATSDIIVILHIIQN